MTLAESSSRISRTSSSSSSASSRSGLIVLAMSRDAGAFITLAANR